MRKPNRGIIVAIRIYAKATSTTGIKALMSVTKRKRPWIEENIPQEIAESREWHNILSFFLIHSPCKPQSNKRHAIEDIWGAKPWLSARYLKRQLNLAITGIDQCPLKKAKNSHELDSELSSANIDGQDFYLKPDRQIAVFTEISGNGNSSVYMSFFYHLRNSLAHARFGFTHNSKGEYVLIFEDGRSKGQDGFEVKARGLIKLESLSNIIETIEAGPSRLPDIESLILGAIENGINTKKKIIQETEIPKEDWAIYSQILRKEKKIISNNKKWFLVDKNQTSQNKPNAK